MRAFVVGNIVIDETYAVDRIPGVGESVLGGKISGDLGGKATNQAIVLGRSGIQTTLIAGVGADAAASRIRTRIAAEPVTTQLIEIAGQASDTSIVLTDRQGGNAIVTTADCARSLPLERVKASMVQAVANDLVMLQGNLTLSDTAQIIDFARARGMIIALNPSPFEAGIERLMPGLDILFLNEHEARLITSTDGEAAVQALLDLPVSSVVLTLGDRGALLGNQTGIVTVPAHACNVVDSTGAGDTLQSVAIASSLLRGVPLDARALRIAAKAAALTISRPGTAAAFPSEAELSDLMGTAVLKTMPGDDGDAAPRPASQPI